MGVLGHPPSSANRIQTECYSKKDSRGIRMVDQRKARSKKHSREIVRLLLKSTAGHGSWICSSTATRRQSNGLSRSWLIGALERRQ